MSSEIPPVPNVTTTAPTASDVTTAGAIASSSGSGEPSSSTKIGSMEDLKKKAPKLYQKMMEGIAMNICNDMKHHQDHLKELMREANRTH